MDGGGVMGGAKGTERIERSRDMRGWIGVDGVEDWGATWVGRGGSSRW